MEDEGMPDMLLLCIKDFGQTWYENDFLKAQSW